MKWFKGNNPYLWLAVLLSLYTLFDYFEHTNRPGSLFAAHPMQWLMFTFTSLLVLLFVMIGLSQVLKRFIKGYAPLCELAGLLGAILIHIWVSGPLLNMIFWPHAELNFRFNSLSVLVFSGAFLLYRLVIYKGIRLAAGRFKK
ncbi:hypothetical protein [Robertkochia aurantiaca]|uniref:hypothetical protein n=1 Tax=Robertkochia aurantiaca TaxID=2873700 RepID=UPI001CCB9A81|nr:hypothetical protein [Robertkochia sp. 3YJGBD-33]